MQELPHRSSDPDNDPQTTEPSRPDSFRWTDEVGDGTVAVVGFDNFTPGAITFTVGRHTRQTTAVQLTDSNKIGLLIDWLKSRSGAPTDISAESQIQFDTADGRQQVAHIYATNVRLQRLALAHQHGDDPTPQDELVQRLDQTHQAVSKLIDLLRGNSGSLLPDTVTDPVIECLTITQTKSRIVFTAVGDISYFEIAPSVAQALADWLAKGTTTLKSVWG